MMQPSRLKTDQYIVDQSLNHPAGPDCQAQSPTHTVFSNPSTHSLDHHFHNHEQPHDATHASACTKPPCSTKNVPLQLQKTRMEKSALKPRDLLLKALWLPQPKRAAALREWCLQKGGPGSEELCGLRQCWCANRNTKLPNSQQLLTLN
eukprot:Filipodium_phascolosomae@DN98_c0_g1_i1.p1